MRNRLQAFLQHKGITAYRFTQDCALPKNFFHGKSDGISTQALASILDAYPELNPLWVISGKGAMLRDDDADTAALRARIASLEAKLEQLRKIICS